MTIDNTEVMEKEELLQQFRSRYENIVNENRQLSAKLKENENTALKLLGAIETLEYLTKDGSEVESQVEE
jgi:hypothetical protein